MVNIFGMANIFAMLIIFATLAVFATLADLLHLSMRQSSIQGLPERGCKYFHYHLSYQAVSSR